MLYCLSQHFQNSVHINCRQLIMPVLYHTCHLTTWQFSNHSATCVFVTELHKVVRQGRQFCHPFLNNLYQKPENSQPHRIQQVCTNRPRDSRKSYYPLEGGINHWQRTRPGHQMDTYRKFELLHRSLVDWTIFYSNIDVNIFSAVFREYKEERWM